MLLRTITGRVMPALVCGLWLANAADADMQTFSATIPLTTTNWNLPVSISKFDPALGNLLTVQISVAANIQGSVKFESLDAQAATVTTTLSTDIKVLRPDTTLILSAAPGVTNSDVVTAFDGTIDFRGTSGKTYPSLSASANQSHTSPRPQSDLVLFTGPSGSPGNITLTATATGTSTGSGAGNLVTQFQTQAGATITVIYTYAPDCNHNGIPDNIDIQNGTSHDCDNNGVPDECQPDCDHNGIPDVCEPDCNHNGIPDACDPVPCSPCLQLNRHTPGSLLLFPEFDNRASKMTLVTVTNTDCDPASGIISVEWVYIGKYDQHNNPLPCLEFNRTRDLTPCDTITVWTNADDPQFSRGFLYVFAKNKITGKAVVFNHLIGQEILMGPAGDLEHADDGLNAVVFRGIGAEGSNTDHENGGQGDGIRDLDGMEYDQAPDQLLIPRFLGADLPTTDQPPSGFNSRLILVGLSGGTAFTTVVDFAVYNDNEEAFSAQYAFQCWDSVDLRDIDGVFTNQFLQSTNNNPNEILGAPTRESGWFRINGNIATSTQVAIPDPAIYAVLVERSNTMSVCDLPYELCTQANGDLLPTSIFGDTP